MYYKRNTQSRPRNHCCRGKAIIITYSECVFRSLSLQHPNGMRRIMLSVSCLVLPFFSTLSHKRYDFLRKKLLNKKGVF